MTIRTRTLPDGSRRYDVEVRVESRNGQGRKKKVTRTVRTKQQALTLEAELKGEARRGGVRNSRITVGQLLDDWVEFHSHGDNAWSATTRYGYVRIIERDLRPALGNRKLDRLTGKDLDDLYTEMRKRGVGSGTVHNTHSVIRAALNQARRWKLVPYNVALDATPGRVHRAEGVVATEAEVQALSTAALEKADPRAMLALLVASETGMRRSELAGLDWGDFDWRESTVTVQRARVDAGGHVYVQPTKTHAIRVIPLAAEVVTVLKQHRGIGWAFPTPRVLSNVLDDLCKAAGVDPLPETGMRRRQKKVGWHAFRHYLLTELGGVADIKTVADIAGHSTTRMTEKYMHSRHDRAVAAIQARARQRAGHS